MGFQKVRALQPVNHDNKIRIPGVTTGENAQDFVVSDVQAAALEALGVVSLLGVVADEPTKLVSMEMLVGQESGRGVGLPVAAADVVRGVAPTRATGLIRQSAHQGAPVTANNSFSCQFQALGPYSGYKLIYGNTDTSPLEITLSKAAGAPTDLHNGTGLTWATVAQALTVPAGVLDGSHRVSGLVKSALVVSNNVPRTDIPSEPPLLLARTHQINAGNINQINSATNAELLTAQGWRFASGFAGGDQVTTPGSITITRNGPWLQPVGVEFFYDRPAKTFADAGDSLFRGRTTSDNNAGFNNLSARVTALKRARGSSVLWTPLSFAVSGQPHTVSMQQARVVASVLRPTYLAIRNWSVNSPMTLDNLNKAWVELLDTLETCLRENVTPIIITTGGQSNNADADLLNLMALNARTLELRRLGYIVVDAIPIAYDAIGRPLAGASLDSTHLTEPYTQAIASAVSDAV